MFMGVIVVLNGVPRSGKSSIQSALVQHSGWMALGVDQMNASLSPSLHPGIGLRPGGERPDLEPMVAQLFLALYRSAAAYAEAGLCVAMDVGHHGSFASIENPLYACAREVQGLSAYLIGVRCPLSVVRERRAATGMAVEDDILACWEREVHRPGVYDLEIDASSLAPEESARQILQRIESPPQAFAGLCVG